jgi:arylsulfatase A-like enzyme
MNIIYIHTHDSGVYLEPYGCKISTPNLTAFARRGTLFRNMFNTFPTCSPSRVALLTGMMPHASGMLGLAHRGFNIKNMNWHLVRFLKTQGYRTALFGMQHEAKNVDDIGYDEVHIDTRLDSEFTTEWDLANVRAAIDFLRRRDTGRPFFLSYGLFHTHRPFREIDFSINPDYTVPPYPIPNNPITRRDMAGYITSAMRADMCIGMLLREIEEQSLFKDSLVFFISDHGLAFPFMKCNLYDAGTNIAFIMDYPQNPAKGKTFNTLLSQIDVYPTLCDICGLPKPSHLTGVSFLPALEGKQREIRSEVYSEVTFHCSYEPKRAVRTERYKLIRHWENIMPANIDNSPTKDFMIENGLLDLPVKGDHLFDLYFDPHERNNLSGDPRYANIYAEMKHKLESFMEKTDDPLAKGFVERPREVFVNKPSCVNPDSKNLEDYEYDVPPYI